MEENKKILVVDDSSTNVKILINLLSDYYDILVALNGKMALEILEEEDPEIILLDIIMPEIDGFELCKILKSNYKTKDIPVIFLTSSDDDLSIEKAYDVGGIDYISKPFKHKELLARIRTQLKMRSLIENLEFLSSYDELTGIYNRRKFFEIANIMFERKQHNFFAVIIDIDKFKKINDTYGHYYGDNVLKKLASKINDLILDDMVFARLGGEEFVIAGEYNKNEVSTFVEEIRQEVSKLVIDTEIKDLRITISCGVSFYNGKFKTIDEFLNDADKCLYEAKNSGRNKSIFR